MKVLLVDDDLDKISDILSVLTSVKDDLNVDSCYDVRSAKIKLRENKYDFLITDLCLPLEVGGELTEDGGRILVQEIKRKKNLKTPSHIIGITQYEEYLNNFDQLWRTIKYSPTEEAWRKMLIEFVSHIQSSKELDKEYQETEGVIFVEGLTDLRIIKEAFQIFHEDKNEKFKIVSESNAGANWVIKQLIIWAYQQKKNSTGNCIPAIGLLDDDIAGNEAKVELRRVIPDNSSYRNYIKTFQLNSRYNFILVSLCKKNIKVPVAIEELCHPTVLKKAEEYGYLEERELTKILINPSLWNHKELNSREYLETLDLTEDEKLYIKQIKFKEKVRFSKLICDPEEIQKDESLKNYKFVLDDILNKFASIFD